MPSATATFFLNVSAIQALCRGENGTALRYTSGGAPTTSFGASGDFAFDLVGSPNYYDLYGPKTTVWPATAIRLTTFSQVTSYVSTFSSTSGWQVYLITDGVSGNAQLSALKINIPTSLSAYPLDVRANNMPLFRIHNTGNVAVSGGFYINHPIVSNLSLGIEDTIKTGTNAAVMSGDVLIKGAFATQATANLSAGVIFGAPSLTSSVSSRKNFVYDHKSGFVGVGINWSQLSELSAYGSLYVQGGPQGLPVVIRDSSLAVLGNDGSTITLGASGYKVGVKVPSVAGLTADLTVNGSISARDCIISAVTADTFRITSNTFNAQAGTTYVLVGNDNGKFITMSNATSSTVAVPAGLPVGFNCSIAQLSLSAVYLSAGPGVTINSRGGLMRTNGQYSQATLVSYSSNIYLLGGDLT